MARLTSFSRFLIVLVVVGVLFFLARTFLMKNGTLAPSSPNTEQTSTTTTTTSDPTPAEPTSTTNNPSATATQTARAPFNYTPPTPVNGKLKGVVDMGATGFNSFIITVDAQDRWKLEKADFGPAWSTKAWPATVTLPTA